MIYYIDRCELWGFIREINSVITYLVQIKGAFPYWPGYHPETPILTRDAVEGQYGSRDDNQANMAMPMYQTIYYILPTSRKETRILV
jgi:hypothetical protein